jgi:hypothetical protein
MIKRFALTVTALLLLASAAPAQTIFGAAFNGPGSARLYSISPATGAFALIGSIGFGTVSALATTPDGSLLYGVGFDGTNFVLLTINRFSGAGSAIGPTGVEGPFQDIAFRPSDGKLFGYNGGSIYTINTTTGAATLVGDTGGFPDGNGLAFSAGNILYTANQLRLDIVNQSTGALTTAVPLNYGSAFGPDESRANGMKFNPSTGTLYASVVNGHPGGPWSLATINISTGVVTRIGATVPGLDAITFGTGVPPPAPGAVPAPSSWLLVAIGLASVALYHLRRRRRTTRHAVVGRDLDVY